MSKVFIDADDPVDDAPVWSASNVSPRRSPWVVAPSLTANSQMLTLQGTF